MLYIWLLFAFSSTISISAKALDQFVLKLHWLSLSSLFFWRMPAIFLNLFFVVGGTTFLNKVSSTFENCESGENRLQFVVISSVKKRNNPKSDGDPLSLLLETIWAVSGHSMQSFDAHFTGKRMDTAEFQIAYLKNNKVCHFTSQAVIFFLQTQAVCFHPC